MNYTVDNQLNIESNNSKIFKSAKAKLFASAMMWFGINLFIAFLVGFLCLKFQVWDHLFSNRNFLKGLIIAISLAVIFIVAATLLNKFWIKLNPILSFVCSTILMGIIGFELVTPILYYTKALEPEKIAAVFLLPAALMIIIGLLGSMNLIKIKFVWFITIALVAIMIITSIVSIFVFNKKINTLIIVAGIALGGCYMAIDWWLLHKVSSNEIYDPAELNSWKAIMTHGIYFGFKFAFDYIYVVYYVVMLLKGN
ncbi:MAG0110 family membrane protein [Mycoplasmopsis iners]|uniref:MAG0110 family membrane protein n=1 Tax=Mycoplasmopsis iners TaxID=76630 RepID=UPI000495A07F|nr:Bax inhibitor-1 family protein [Mycoplasmopsis iners]